MSERVCALWLATGSCRGGWTLAAAQLARTRRRRCNLCVQRAFRGAPRPASPLWYLQGKHQRGGNFCVQNERKGGRRRAARAYFWSDERRLAPPKAAEPPATHASAPTACAAISAAEESGTRKTSAGPAASSAAASVLSAAGVLRSAAAEIRPRSSAVVRRPDFSIAESVSPFRSRSERRPACSSFESRRSSWTRRRSCGAGLLPVCFGRKVFSWLKTLIEVSLVPPPAAGATFCVAARSDCVAASTGRAARGARAAGAARGRTAAPERAAPKPVSCGGRQGGMEASLEGQRLCTSKRGRARSGPRARPGWRIAAAKAAPAPCRPWSSASRRRGSVALWAGGALARVRAAGRGPRGEWCEEDVGLRTRRRRGGAPSGCGG